MQVLRTRVCQLRLELLEVGFGQPGGRFDDVPCHPDPQESLDDFDLFPGFAFGPSFRLALGQQLLRISHDVISVVKSLVPECLPKRLNYIEVLCCHQVQVEPAAFVDPGAGLVQQRQALCCEL